MNRFIKLLTLVIIFIFYYVIEIKNVFIPCLFKKIFSISCPMCGISRAIKEILDFNIIASFEYNFLGFFVLLFLIVNCLLLVYDVIFNKNKIIKLYSYLGKYYVVIIVVFIVNMVINNVRGI